ncbi:hypothetical protein HY382_02440 [Candidatus Curtissbacteria bacterium]|nr:hypothetical protein [Candidatus Curtissbacteria bacterium]
MTKEKKVSAINPISEKKRTVEKSPKNLIQNRLLLKFDWVVKWCSAVFLDPSLASLEEKRLCLLGENFTDAYSIKN